MARNTGGHYFDAGNRLAQDGCALQAREEGNVGVNDYLLTNFYAPGCSESRERVKEFAVQNVNLNTVEGYGVQPCHIDGDSSLRLVPPSHGRSRAQLHPREFQAVPDLSRATPAELSKLVGKPLAARLGASLELGRRAMKPRDPKPVMRYAAEVQAYYGPMLGHLRNEVFHVACLDVRNRLLLDKRVAEGGFASCAILPRECFAPVIGAGAVGVIFVHNHPSGETEPSADDIQLTRRLVRAGEVLGTRVIDHVIIGSQEYTSLAERGLLQG